MIETATEPPATEAQMAMALARSAGGNTVARIDRLPGITSAAPTPITPRARISCQVAVANAPAVAAAMKTASPHWSVPLRPKRSPMAPAGSRRPAKHST